MKEFSIEEKAQRYDKAIERAKGVIEQNPLMEYLKKGIEYIFPELKKDETIKKELINYLNNFTNSENKELVNKFVAWLENQVNKDEEILILKDQIESLHAAIKAIKETHKIELEKLGKNSIDISEATKQKLEEEIEEWLGCEAFPEGTNITPLPKAMEIVKKTANHFYDFGRKQQFIRNIQ